MSLPSNTVVMPNRACGKVKPGLYAGSRTSEEGTYLTIALPAPHPSDILSPNAQVQVASNSLDELAGLTPPVGSTGRYKGLPPVALADLWGAVYYKEAWNALDETRKLGPNRRIAQVHDLPLPIPIYMMHKRAVVESDLTWGEIAKWLHENVGFEYWTGCHAQDEPRTLWEMESQPWRIATSLARAGCDDYMWHPWVEFWAILSQLRKDRKLAQFTRECRLRFSPGVIGITWLTEYRYVLGEGEEEVPDQYRRQGVLPAIGVDDPRAKEVVENDEKGTGV